MSYDGIIGEWCAVMFLFFYLGVKWMAVGVVVFFCLFFSSRRRHTRCALVTGVQDVCSSDLHAGAIQNLTLDGRAINHFLRNELDHDPLPGIAVEMVHR